MGEAEGSVIVAVGEAAAMACADLDGVALAVVVPERGLVSSDIHVRHFRPPVCQHTGGRGSRQKARETDFATFLQ